MSHSQYQRHAGSVYSLNYHLFGCSKSRRRVLLGGIAEELRARLDPKAQELEVTIEALEITPALAAGASVPDPVHLFIQSDPTEAPQRLANQFKGFTSRGCARSFLNCVLAFRVCGTEAITLVL